jgi:dipeptidyl aminopeptidase/acylaminoacyl peptidase
MRLPALLPILLLCACAPKPTPPGPSAGALPVGPLIFDGTPEIPDVLRERMTRYLNLRSAGLADLSADGSEMLINTRFGDTRQVHRLRMPMGARQQLTFFEEPVGGAEFVPGSNAISFVRDLGGDEQYQILRMELDTRSTTLLTDGKSRHGAALWSTDGTMLAFTGNARNGRDMDIYLSDGRDPASARLLVEASGYYSPVEFSPDGSKLLVSEYVSITESHLYLIDTGSGDMQRLTPEEPTAAYRSARFHPDGVRLFLTSDREGEYRQLYELSLADGRWRPMLPDLDWDIEGLAPSPDGTVLAYTANEEGFRVLHLLDLASGEELPVPDTPRGLVNSIQFARSAPVLGFSITGPGLPGDVFTWDLRGDATAVRWTESELGGLDPARFVMPTTVRFQSFDDLEVPATYYRPAGDGPHPVVIDIHGGPEGQARPWFNTDTQYLAGEAGVAVLVPNVRGSSGYGKSYVKLDNGMLREDSVKDIGALLDWIETRPELDAGRVAVTGGSYGGYMVLASLVHYSERLRAGIDVVGISNFVTFLENTKAYRQDLRRVEYGDERDPEMRAHLEAISPVNNVERIQSALFVVHGANDPRVPVGEAEQIVEAVRAQGHEVWYLLALNEGHGFSKKENRDVYRLMKALFLEKHLAAP